ncbi:MAG: LysM peptidoglycan-binding domain-containing protein [Caldilineales bacterium]|nr:LysM peptidoglycan-binding domain-containing protein [Caldilineales bacterium]
MRKPLFLALALAIVLSLFPLAALTQTAEAGGCVAVYVVKRGDTLTIIARKYGVSNAQLAKANNIQNRNRIYVGQRLCIPGYIPPPPPPPPPTQQPGGYYPPPPHPGDGPQCSYMPVLGFGRVWAQYPQVRSGLGCATAPETGFAANQEAFAQGTAIQNLDSKVIYILYSNGWWESYPDTWVEGDAVVNPALVPPYGYYQPAYGIGKVWRNYDNVSQRLGWAKNQQYPVQATRQQFEKGQMIWTSSSGVFVLYSNGTWQLYK